MSVASSAIGPSDPAGFSAGSLRCCPAGQLEYAAVIVSDWDGDRGTLAFRVEVCVELACLALAGGGTRELGVRITEYVSPRCRSRSLWEAP